MHAYRLNILKLLILAILAMGFSACAVELKTKVSGNLKRLSPLQTVAILPFETAEMGQSEIADLLRQSLYANLQDSNFTLMEPYLIDSLLEKKGWKDPENFSRVNPMEFAELLGADAVVLGRVDKIERSYWVLHSSIELGVSVQMIDTRSGEVLWKAEQREKDFEGLGKIPTGITAAVFAPLEYVTNKLNLHKLMTGMVSRLTAIVKFPGDIKESEVASVPEILPASTEGVKELKAQQKMQEEWEDAVQADQPKVEKNQPKPEEQKAKPLNTLSRAPNNITDTKGLISKLQAPIPPTQPSALNKIKQPVMKENPQLKRESSTVSKKSTPFIPKQTALTVEKRPHLKAPPAQPLAKIEKREAPGTLYTVQVGAYTTKSFAEKLNGNLAKKGYHVFVTLFSRNKKRLYRVQVDKFKNKEEALEMAQRIRTKEKLPSFITTFRG